MHSSLPWDSLFNRLSLVTQATDPNAGEIITTIRSMRFIIELDVYWIWISLCGWGNLMKIYENVSRSANAYLEVLVGQLLSAVSSCYQNGKK